LHGIFEQDLNLLKLSNLLCPKSLLALLAIIRLTRKAFCAMAFRATTFSITTFSMTINKMRQSALRGTQNKILLCWVSFVLNFTNKSLMLSVVVLNVVMLSV